MINEVTLLGNLGSDPTLRHTSNGTPVANFRMATNDSWVSNGQRQERTEWHNVTVWGKMGEAAAKHLSKGRQVFIKGRIQTSTFKDRDGVTRYKTEIIASKVKFLGGSQAQASKQNVSAEEVPTAEVEPSLEAEAAELFTQE